MEGCQDIELSRYMETWSVYAMYPTVYLGLNCKIYASVYYANFFAPHLIEIFI